MPPGGQRSVQKRSNHFLRKLSNQIIASNHFDEREYDIEFQKISAKSPDNFNRVCFDGDRIQFELFGL